MKTIDLGFYFVTYNFIIGILLMVASEKIGAFIGYFTGSYKEKISRLARVGICTFGACAAILMGCIYLIGYILKL